MTAGPNLCGTRNDATTDLGRGLPGAKWSPSRNRCASLHTPGAKKLRSETIASTLLEGVVTTIRRADTWPINRSWIQFIERRHLEVRQKRECSPLLKGIPSTEVRYR